MVREEEGEAPELLEPGDVRREAWDPHTSRGDKELRAPLQLCGCGGPGSSWQLHRGANICRGR